MSKPNAEDVPGREITVTVNGVQRSAWCADRTLLVHFVREQLALPGTHVGCLNGDCGACSVLVDDALVKSCLQLAAAADGAEITTVEGLGEPGNLHPVQEAFWAEDGFQCGFCLPGHLLVTLKLAEQKEDPSEEEIRSALAGNLCRCTGYQSIVAAVRRAVRQPEGA